MANGLTIFAGNCPKNVSKDAKYSIRTGRDGLVVALTYISANQERWFATTEDHPDLVDMVNKVKTEAGGAPNGPFYINEYGQVIVPVGPSATYYLAGEYDMPLRFEFEGNSLSGEGIVYRLKSGRPDVYYRSYPRPGVETRPQLSTAVGREAASAFADRIREAKGWEGGRFYINEWREIFAPVSNGDGLEYRYIGHLELSEPWFPKAI
jgi:hypothetical protein